jgi:Ni/Fe-hydrogenase 1 B-type cytochrome subunit
MVEKQAKKLRHPKSYRILHECIMTSVLFLILTGLYIHRPFFGNGGGFLMTLDRGVHFFFAGVLIIAGILRIILLFCGPNRDIKTFVVTTSDIKKIPAVIKYYALFTAEPPTEKKYNPLQMATYGVTFLMVLFQILSGIALLNPPGGPFHFLNYGIFASEIGTRICHYVVTWLFLIFLIIHVYLAIRESFTEIKQIHLLTGGDEEETIKEEKYYDTERQPRVSDDTGAGQCAPQ